VRPILACDVDDVLFDFYEELAAFFNNILGGGLHKSDFTSYFVHEVLRCAVEVARGYVHRFYASDTFRNMHIVPDTVEAIQRLTDTYTLHAVTGRACYLGSLTQEMIDCHFPDCFAGIHHTEAFSGSSVCDWSVKMCVN